MNPLTQFRKTTILPFVVVVLGLLCFGFLPVVEAAVSPAPDAADVTTVDGAWSRMKERKFSPHICQIVWRTTSMNSSWRFARRRT
jgi:hypothetical protein